MKKRYLIALLAGCTLMMIGCSNQQKDSVTDPDTPAVTDSTGLTEGEAEVAGQGTDMSTDTGTVNGTTAGNGQSDDSSTTTGDEQNDAGSQGSVADTTGSPAVSTKKENTAAPKDSNNQSKKQSKKQTSSSSQEDIGMEAAKKIALGKAGLTEQDGSWKEEKRDRENGRIVYELEFVSGNMEYEFEIDAQHGKILEYQQDPIDTL